MDTYQSIVNIPKSKTILGSLGNAGLNAFGGFVAGRVRGTLASLAPSIKSGGTIGIFFIAAAVHYVGARMPKIGPLLKEIAAGMAGFVGNDLWFVLRALLKWGQWKPETAYKAGDIVLVERDGQTEYYKADKDIPATPNAEPGRDSRWVRFETAQGVSITEITEFAQALSKNDALLDGIVKEQLLIFGPELAQAMGRELNQSEADNIYSGMRDSLKSVVIRFSEGN